MLQGDNLPFCKTVSPWTTREYTSWKDISNSVSWFDEHMQHADVKKGKNFTENEALQRRSFLARSISPRVVQCFQPNGVLWRKRDCTAPMNMLKMHFLKLTSYQTLVGRNDWNECGWVSKNMKIKKTYAHVQPSF